jgi:type IV pilus assembly protein PilX
MIRDISMRTPFESLGNRSRQDGVILFVALILLVILSLIGVTAARMQTVEERMARNEDNRMTGAQAAEAALRNAEAGILQGLWGAAQFAANSNGTYELTASSGSVVPTINWQTATAPTVLFYNGATIVGPALSAIAGNAQVPKYVIESLPPVAVPGESIGQVQYAAPTTPVAVYRITANGQGADSTSSTTLQSIFR